MGAGRPGEPEERDGQEREHRGDPAALEPARLRVAGVMGGVAVSPERCRDPLLPARDPGE